MIKELIEEVIRVVCLVGGLALIVIPFLFNHIMASGIISMLVGYAMVVYGVCLTMEGGNI